MSWDNSRTVLRVCALLAAQIEVQEIGGQHCIVLQQDASLGRCAVLVLLLQHLDCRRRLCQCPPAPLRQLSVITVIQQQHSPEDRCLRGCWV